MDLKDKEIDFKGVDFPFNLGLKIIDKKCPVYTIALRFFSVRSAQIFLDRKTVFWWHIYLPAMNHLNLGETIENELIHRG